jgi:flagellar motor switch protein FliG
MSAAAKASATKTELGDYSGVERAAIVMLCLGDQAPSLLQLLEEDEVREVSSVMASLGAVPGKVIEAVVADFFARMSGSGFLMGSIEQTHRMLSQVLPPERVEAIMEELRGPAGRSLWDKLGNANHALLASYLANEYPQTAAVVLSKVPPTVAASVLSALPHDFAVNTIERMLVIEPVQRDILQKVESTLRSEFISSLNSAPKRDNHEAMAEIFNHLDHQREARFMNQLGGKDLESAERIRSLMFVFGDLVELDPAGVQTLLRAADKKDLAFALKGASEAISKLFFSNMSERGAKLLREDMAGLGPVRVKDVEASQTRIVAIAKDLASRGELMLATGAADELIY